MSCAFAYLQVPDARPAQRVTTEEASKAHAEAMAKRATVEVNKSARKQLGTAFGDMLKGKAEEAAPAIDVSKMESYVRSEPNVVTCVFCLAPFLFMAERSATCSRSKPKWLRPSIDAAKVESCVRTTLQRLLPEPSEPNTSAGDTTATSARRKAPVLMNERQNQS